MSKQLNRERLKIEQLMSISHRIHHNSRRFTIKQEMEDEHRRNINYHRVRPVVDAGGRLGKTDRKDQERSPISYSFPVRDGSRLKRKNESLER